MAIFGIYVKVVGCRHVVMPLGFLRHMGVSWSNKTQEDLDIAETCQSRRPRVQDFPKAWKQKLYSCTLGSF